ncbi:PAS domain S-box protein [Capilliphycus salinus ALCB114379]|uniref:PAS domain S-box protein n=1 Tax=Capilliphycus salinus TaxID=2768948 RepID=UPI0039A4C141
MKNINPAIALGEEQLSQILEILPIGVAVIHRESGHTYLNQKGRALLEQEANTRISLKELLKTYPIYRLGTEERYPYQELPIVQALKGKRIKAKDLEIRIQTKVICLEVEATPILDEQGKVICAVVTFEDITEHKRIEAERLKAENALWESQHRFATLAKAAPVGIFRTDTQGKCLYGNDISFEMIGLSQEESMGEGWTKTLHPDDVEDVQKKWYAFALNGVPFKCEYRFLRPDGSIIWVYGQAVAETDINGNVIGYVGTITDITGTKETELALQQSEAKYRRLAENIPGVIYRYVLHPDGKDEFIYVSPRIKEVYGIEPEIILEDSANSWNIIVAEDVEKLRFSTLISCQTLQPWSQEYRITKPDGEIRWMEGFSIPEKQPNGDVIWDGFIIDISSRKKAEETLKEREAYLRMVVNNVPVILWATDNNGIFTLSEGKGLEGLGLQAGDVVGKSAYEIYADFPSIIRGIHETLTTGSSYHAQVEVNGRFFEALGNAFSDEQGNCLGIIGASFDITERQQVEQILADYNRILEAKVAERTEALRQSEEKFRAIFNQVFQFIGLIKPDGTLLEANQTALDFGGINLEDIVNKPFWEAPWWKISPQTQQQLKEAITKAAQGEFIHYEVDVLGKNTIATIDFSIRPIRNNQGEIILLIPEGRDITERKQMEEALRKANLELERLATLDSLTQVANRRYFQNYLEQEWKRLTREQQPLSLILCDVDYFKRYNDHYGHPAGDDCLIKVARAMQLAVKRPADLIARYGGEEFVIILPNTNLAGAIKVAEEIQEKIHQLGIPHAQSQVSQLVTLSLGVTSLIPGVEKTTAELIEVADTALYRAKKLGRNRIFPSVPPQIVQNIGCEYLATPLVSE